MRASCNGRSWSGPACPTTSCRKRFRRHVRFFYGIPATSSAAFASCSPRFSVSPLSSPAPSGCGFWKSAGDQAATRISTGSGANRDAGVPMPAPDPTAHLASRSSPYPCWAARNGAIIGAGLKTPGVGTPRPAVPQALVAVLGLSWQARQGRVCAPPPARQLAHDVRMPPAPAPDAGMARRHGRIAPACVRHAGRFERKSELENVRVSRRHAYRGIRP